MRTLIFIVFCGLCLRFFKNRIVFKQTRDAKQLREINVKFHDKFSIRLGKSFDAFLHCFWSQNGSLGHPKIDKNRKESAWYLLLGGQGGPRGSQEAPRGSQEVSKRPQETPKRLPRWPKRDPRDPQDGPKGTRETPKRSQETPRDPQDDPRDPENHPRRLQETAKTRRDGETGLE